MTRRHTCIFCTPTPFTLGAVTGGFFCTVGDPVDNDPTGSVGCVLTVSGDSESENKNNMHKIWTSHSFTNTVLK